MSQQQANEIGHDGQSAFGALQQRVTHAEDRLSEIKTELRELNISVKELNSTIASMGKPHFQTWAAVGGLVVSISAGAWWLAIAPINARLATIDSTILPREMSLDKFAQFKEDGIRLQNEIDARATKDDLNRLIIELDRRLPKPRDR